MYLFPVQYCEEKELLYFAEVLKSVIGNKSCLKAKNFDYKGEPAVTHELCAQDRKDAHAAYGFYVKHEKEEIEDPIEFWIGSINFPRRSCHDKGVYVWVDEKMTGHFTCHTKPGFRTFAHDPSFTYNKELYLRLDDSLLANLFSTNSTVNNRVNDEAVLIQFINEVINAIQ